MKLTRRSIIQLISAIVTLPGRAMSAVKDACYTDSDVTGPFYRPDAPFRTNLLLDTYKFPGAKTVVVSGIVYGDDCHTPIPNAVVEIWQADPDGHYDMKSSRFLGRARIATNSIGKYRFKTYVPGYYTDAGLARPKHIHFVISAAGHQSLTTQLYFKGDKRLSSDPFVKSNDGLNRAMDFSTQANGHHLMTFNIFLKRLP